MLQLRFTLLCVISLQMLCGALASYADNTRVTSTISSGFDSSNFPAANELRKLLDQPENKIDFAKTKLAVDKIIDPSIDTKANLNRIDGMVKAIQTMLPANATSMDKMFTLKKYLYEAGAWNNNQPYQYDLNDPLGNKFNTRLLTTYLDTKKGNCVSMPILFVALGQRLGIDVTLSTAPEHLFVKYTDSDNNTTYNLETTSGANFTREVYYQQTTNVTDLALKNKVFLQKLTKRESAAMMALTVGENYFDKEHYVNAMMIADVVLKYYPNAIEAMLMKGATFYKLLQINFFSNGIAIANVYDDERPIYQFLSMNNVYWYNKAEALGWKPPTKEDKDAYLDTVAQAASKLKK